MPISPYRAAGASRDLIERAAPTADARPKAMPLLGVGHRLPSTLKAARYRQKSRTTLSIILFAGAVAAECGPAVQVRR